MNEQKERQPIDQSPQELKTILLNVDFSSIKPTSAKIHPEWESLMRLTQLRVTEELGPKFRLGEDVLQFSFYMFPSLSSDIVSSILICNMAGFTVNDYLDKFPSENEKIVQKFKSKSFPENTIVDKWWQLGIKVYREAMGETVLNQFLDLHASSLSKADEANKIFSAASPFTDQEFLEWRHVDSGFLHQLFLLLVGTGNQISDELMQDPNYLGLTKQVAIHASLINDLYSLRKEIRDDVYRYNYVLVKMTNNNVSAQVAVDAIIGEIFDAERMAHVYGDKLKERQDPYLLRYVDEMYGIIIGNHYWSSICKRYNDL